MPRSAQVLPDSHSIAPGMRDRLSNPLHAQGLLPFLHPSPQSTFLISPEAVWPSIRFELPASSAELAHAFTWNWRLEWDSFSKSGTVETSTCWWDAREAIAGCGGTLSVNTISPEGTADISVLIRGANPSAAAIAAYLATKPDSSVFSRILQQESLGRHFDAQGCPKKSPDRGYGLCQLTHPAPTFEECWHWQRNLDCGWNLFLIKQREARAYLSGGNRSFTPEQLQYETAARWNGGRYHIWSDAAKAWVRNPVVLCNGKTGNIGWNLANPANAGKTEAELYSRDAGQFHRLPTASDNWGYFGVCYADRILKQLN